MANPSPFGSISALGAAVVIVLVAVLVANAVIGLVVGGHSCGGSVLSWCADE
jgi:predicted alpha/beta-hydrolase family hydrolase